MRVYKRDLSMYQPGHRPVSTGLFDKWLGAQIDDRLVKVQLSTGEELLVIEGDHALRGSPLFRIMTPSLLSHQNPITLFFNNTTDSGQQEPWIDIHSSVNRFKS